MGICHSLGSPWWGCAPTCFAFPVCQVGGPRLQSCLHHSTRHRWWHGCMWPVLTPADGFATDQFTRSQDAGWDQVCAWLLWPHSVISGALCPILGLAHCLPCIAGGLC